MKEIKISHKKFIVITILLFSSIEIGFFKFMLDLYQKSLDDFFIILSCLGMVAVLSIFWLICEARRSQDVDFNLGDEGAESKPRDSKNEEITAASDERKIKDMSDLQKPVSTEEHTAKSVRPRVRAEV